MEVVPATTDQIALFKLGAAQYYKKAGVNPAIADQLFNTQMAKMANDMGVAPRNEAKIQKIASAVAQSVGRTRKVK